MTIVVLGLGLLSLFCNPGSKIMLNFAFLFWDLLPSSASVDHGSDSPAGSSISTARPGSSCWIMIGAAAPTALAGLGHSRQCSLKPLR